MMNNESFCNNEILFFVGQTYSNRNEEVEGESMRNRCILCLFICGALLYYALPQLTLHGNSLATYFSWSWLIFLFMAVAGNLAAVLYTPVTKQHRQKEQVQIRKKLRSYD